MPVGISAKTLHQEIDKGANARSNMPVRRVERVDRNIWGRPIRHDMNECARLEVIADHKFRDLNYAQTVRSGFDEHFPIVRAEPAIDPHIRALA
ncbi:MAG: hypothetical protein AAF619_11530 [Pseudomonadota bacterium]